MVIVASLPGLNLFSSLPSTPRNDPTASSSSPSPPQPPIPIPKYPPPLKKSKNPQTNTPSPAFKLPHRRTNYYKPVKEGVVSSDGDRSVIVGENGVSYLLPGAPFDFQYSYSETPKVKPLAIREPAFLPFAPPTMPRPWTGKAPMKKSKKKIPLFDSFNSPPPDKEGMKCLEMPGPFPMRKFRVERRSREEILGKPLKRWEIKMLIKPLFSHNRQVNLGRDGLTHNMLELIHTHWRRSPVCKVRCLGVPTVDMDNVCHHLEERTGGQIVHKTGGVVYLFRGRNYDPLTRPRYPVMLWKPAAPVYPKLIQEAPEGLTKAEADELRKKGKDLLPICKLAKNGVYITLVADVRNAFEGSPLVKINCKGMNPSDYKKLGAKLKELVPCVLLSFDDEQILMWRGQNWKSIYPEVPSANIPTEEHVASGSEDSALPGICCSIDELNDEDRRGENKIKEFEKNEKRRKANDHINSGEFDVDSTKPASILSSSPKMMSLWKHAIESSKAILLDEIDLGADDLLRKVEEFEGISQVTEHSYPAVILSSEDDANNTLSAFEDGPLSVKFGEDDTDTDDEYEYEDDEYYDSDPFEERDTTVPLGSLPVDLIAEKLDQE